MVRILMDNTVWSTVMALMAGLVSCTLHEKKPSFHQEDIKQKVLEIAEGKKLPSLTLTISQQGSVWSMKYNNEDVEKQKIYGIGSTTKLLSAVLVLKLAEQGKVSLEDKLVKHVGNLGHVENIENTTVRNILSHTSGLQDFTKHPSWIQMVITNNTPKTFEQKMSLVDGKRNTSGVFAYSNTNYLVLEKVVESISGKSYTKAFNEFYADQGFGEIRLGRPETKIQSFFAETLDAISEVSDWCEHYGYAGGVYTTSEALHRFSEALFIDGAILNQESMDQLKKWVPMIPDTIPIGTEGKIAEYGNGLMKLTYNGKEYVGHMGGTLKYQSLLFVNEKEKTSMSIITNCSGRYYNNVFFQELVPAILNEL